MNEAGLAHVSVPVDWDEICRLFPEQWIVLVEIGWSDDRGNDTCTAFVAGTGTRREAVAAARPLLSVFELLGCYYTGQARFPTLPPILYTSARVVESVASPAHDVFAFA